MAFAILNIVVYIAELLIAFSFFNKNYNKRFKSTVVIFAVGLVLFVSAALIFIAFGNEVINLSIFFLINFLFAVICFEISVKSAALQSVLLDALMYCSEMLVIFLGSAIIKIPTDTYKENLTVYFVLVTMCKLVYLILSQIVSFIIRKDKFDNLKTKFLFPLFVFPVLSMVTCSVFLFIALRVELSAGFQVSVFVISVLFILTCVCIFIYYQILIEKEDKIKDLEFEQQKQQIDTQYLQIIEQNNKNSAILVHDMKNHLQHITSLADTQEVRSYVESIFQEVQSYGYIGMSKNKTLDLLISKYLNLCQGKGIKIDFDVKTANLSSVSPTDVSTIINNLLDNAVESAEQSKAKTISVSIFKKQGFEILKIQNSCDTKPQTKNGNLLTTKKEKQLHGYGTQSVIKTINKYDGMFDWEYSEGEEMFTVTVALSINI